MARTLTIEELRGLGLSEDKIKLILAKQTEPKPPRRLKHIVFLTEDEVDRVKKDHPEWNVKRPNYK